MYKFNKKLITMAYL